jgi:hypothetical protein
LELLQRSRKVGPAHAVTLPMGAFGVNPISRRELPDPDKILAEVKKL